MTNAEELIVLEEIKKLKSKYFYYLDSKDWERWKSEVWAPDGTLHVPEISDEPVAGADVIAAWTAERMADVLSIHHGHMPNIEILSDDSAKGIWAMEDILRWPQDSAGLDGYRFIHGYGHYRETYTRGPDGWRIKSSQLTRLYVERSQQSK